MLRLRSLLPWIAAFALVPVAAGPALACGGCFIPANSLVVVQDAERILFVRDEATKKSTVWVEVRYNGPPGDFGWVLPLPKVPQIGVGTSYLFDRLDLGTAPRFETPTGAAENCGARDGGGSDGLACGAMETSAAGGDRAAFAPGAPTADGGVQVLDEGQVGPYDHKTIQATDVQDLLDWLDQHGYQMPATAEPVIASHIAKGDVFVAVKLVAGADIKEIKPISLTMEDAEPCVPLRLTSIAAVEDMTVLTYIAGPGRAVPKNHLHVQVNPMRINWFDGASNYGQVLSAAIDEAAGRAFATEFAGKPPAVVEASSNPFDRSEAPLVDLEAIRTEPLAATASAAELLSSMRNRGFPIVTDTAAVLERHLKLAAKAGQTDDLVQFYQNLHEGSRAVQQVGLGKEAIAKIVADLQTEFSGPLAEVLPQVLAAERMTRLAMRISPEEMTKDPVFGFHPSLPDVSRVRRAELNPVCRDGGFNQDAWRVTIDGLGSWVIDLESTRTQTQQGFPVPNNTLDPRFKSSPAALVVEVLEETGEPIAIHPDQIDLVDTAIAGAVWGKPSLPPELALDEAPPRWTPPQSDPLYSSIASGGGCTPEPGQRGPLSAGLLLAAALGAVVLVRRRARG